MIKAEWIGASVCLALLSVGCRPSSSPVVTASSAPVKPVVTAPPVHVDKPGILLPLDTTFKTGEDVWTGKWTFRSAQPLNLKGTLNRHTFSLNTDTIAAQAGKKPVRGSIEVKLRRNGGEVDCEVNLQEEPTDGSPPLMSSSMNLAPMKMKGDLAQLVHDIAPEAEIKLPGEWPLLKYKYEGAWHAVKLKATFAEPKNARPAGNFRSGALK